MLRMAAANLVVRSLRRNLVGSMLVIALLAGAAGGLATGLLDGADRTRTAAERFISESRLLDAMVTDPTLTLEQTEQIRAIPGVRGASLLSGLALFPDNGKFINLTASLDGRWGTDLDVARIVRGRAVDPAAHDEIVLGEAAARALGVDVGDEARFNSWSPEQLAEWQESEPSEAEELTFLGPAIALKVVGISRHPADLSSDDPLSFLTALPFGVWQAYQGRVGEFGFRFVAVDLGDDPSPAEEAAVADAVRQIVGPAAAFEDAGAQAGGPLMTTLDFVAAALLALAAAVVVGGLVAVALLVLRTVARVAEETALLRALGMTGTEQARATTTALGPAAVAAGVITVAVAVLSSAFMPFGLARRAEPHPGIHVDAPLVVAGAATTAALLLGLIALAATRSARRIRSEARSGRQRLKPRLAPSNVPVGAVCGLDLAFGSGRTAGRGANRGAIAGMALASVAGVGALVLGSSVDHLFTTPAAFGWTWDYTIEAGAADTLVDDPAVASLGLVTATPVSFDGRPLMTRGITSLKGELPLQIVRGRAAEPGEVVLAARTMEDLGVDLGDTVMAAGALEERELQVVGQAVFAGVIEAPEAGWGAAMPLDQLNELGPAGETEETAVVSVADGVDVAAFGQRLADELGIAPDAVEEPVELARLREIEAFPWVLTAFLVTVGVVATGHAVVTTTRRRRGDLAVLRSMGLARRGVYQAISVQAGALALVGAAIGIPLGVVAGRALWRGLARTLGVVVTVEVPWTAIFLATVATCVVLALLALVPARRVARTPPAHALRAE